MKNGQKMRSIRELLTDYNGLNPRYCPKGSYNNDHEIAKEVLGALNGKTLIGEFFGKELYPYQKNILAHSLLTREKREE